MRLSAALQRTGKSEIAAEFARLKSTKGMSYV